MVIPSSAIQWLTDFGDQAVVLPSSIGIFVFLLLSGWWRGALSWVVAMGGTLCVMLVLKLGIGACGWELGIPALNSPSGHTASATMLYGGLATILFPELGVGAWAALVLAITLVFATSRVVLHDHSVLEVIIGGVVGLGGVLVFGRLCRPVPARVRPVWLAVTVAVIALLAHGNRMTAEQHIHSFATLRLRAMLCPTRR